METLALSQPRISVLRQKCLKMMMSMYYIYKIMYVKEKKKCFDLRGTFCIPQRI